MTKERVYEYLIQDIDSFDFPQNELNKLGQEGWELVGLNHKTGFTNYIFKREIIQPNPNPIT